MKTAEANGITRLFRVMSVTVMISDVLGYCDQCGVLL